MNFFLGLQIDWGLLGTKSFAWMGIVKIGSVTILRGSIEAFKEADTWSLSSWVFS